jgi:hypothetical protein
MINHFCKTIEPGEYTPTYEMLSNVGILPVDAAIIGPVVD